MNRRRVLGLTAGSVVGATALGAFSGTALAWEEELIEFKGCTSVWLVTAWSDIKDGSNPQATRPPVANVVVGLEDGSTECRELRATYENATSVPGQYGDLAVLKMEVDDGEKVLGIILYNRVPRTGDWENERFDDPSCYAINEHTCAMTPDSGDFYDSDCYKEAEANGTRPCPDGVTGSWETGGGKGRNN